MTRSLYMVVGLGKTGHSIARYLHRNNKNFVVFDTRAHPEGLDGFYANFSGVEVFLGSIPDSIYGCLIEIIASPGVDLNSDFIRKAHDMGISIIGDIECLAREIRAPVIAITGTNGKSTVTTLVGEMAKSCGMNVAVAGNIGCPVLDLLDNGIKYDLWVLELSSFQLDLCYTLAPIAATILNISPDHLDRHHNIEAYVLSKQRIYRGAKLCLFNRDDPQTRATESVAFSRSYGLDVPTAGNWGVVSVGAIHYIYYGAEKILALDTLRIKGLHNWQNAVAACALANEASIGLEYIRASLENFSGLAHRTQWVRTLAGVDWIDDSKGTNVGATLAAIAGIGASISGKIVLIAGGQAKGADFSILRETVSKYVRSVILIGKDAGLLVRDLIDITPIAQTSTLELAVSLAKAQASSGDVVLLSPACASLDMFRDFNHRGDVFIKAVHAL